MSMSEVRCGDEHAQCFDNSGMFVFGQAGESIDRDKNPKHYLESDRPDITRIIEVAPSAGIVATHAVSQSELPGVS